MRNILDNELKVTAGNPYKNIFQNTININKHDDSKQVYKSIELQNRQTTLNTIKKIVGIHDKTQTLSSSYSDIRADTIEQMTEKRNENENVLINNDINTIQEGDNENKKEKKRYVAKDDDDNKVANTITLGNNYLLGAEIKVNDGIINFQDGDISNEIGVCISNNTRYNEILETSKKEKHSLLYFYNRK